jgi:cytochrome c biogenesis factor
MLFGNLSLGLALLSALFSAFFFLLGAEETAEDILILNVSKKPLINLFWLGIIFILFSLIIATYRRTKEITVNNN